MNNSLAQGKKQIKLWESRRIVLAVSLLLITVIAAVGMSSIKSSAVRYENSLPQATPPEVCPGDTFTYPMRIVVSKGDTVVRITEDWRKADTNIHPKEFVAPPIEYNIEAPTVIEANATRMVPANMPPGEWVMGHCNTSTRDAELPEVSCYYIPITVKAPSECQATP